MPMGLDLKSVLVGVLLAYFVIPFIRAKLAARSAPAATA